MNRQDTPLPEVEPLVARKVAFAAAIAGLIPLLAGGVVTVSANRLVAGEALSLWGAAGGGVAGAFLLGNLALIVCCLRPVPQWIRNTLVGGVPCIILPSLLLLAGQVAAHTAAEAGPIVRVSLGTAFWVWLFIAPMIFADTLSRVRGRSRVLLVVAAIVAATLMAASLPLGWIDHLSVVKEYANRQDRFLAELRTHLALSGASVGLACLIGVPLGYLAHVKKKVEVPTFFLLNILQTLPSLALFSILIPLLAALVAWMPLLGEFGIRGIGTAPALIALTLYSILPVARNTHIGFRTVDPAMREAGRGMGMTRTQLMRRVELPIASPIILNGLRIALVQVLGLTAVAALIGAGGFGVFIFQGLGQAANDLILLGAIPTVLVAVVADTAMQGLIMLVRPRGT